MLVMLLKDRTDYTAHKSQGISGLYVTLLACINYDYFIVCIKMMFNTAYLPSFIRNLAWPDLLQIIVCHRFVLHCI